MTNYSAKHWAIKAEKSAKDAESYASGIDLSNYATKPDLQSVRSEFEEEDAGIRNEINTLKDSIESDISEINQQIANKASKDLSDVTQEGKSTVVGWGMPDYSAGISKSKGVIYQAECDGYLHVFNSQTDTDHTAISLEIGFNSDLSDAIRILNGYSSPSTNLQMAGIVPVVKGMYYTIKAATQGTPKFTFYPAKGAI